MFDKDLEVMLQPRGMVGAEMNPCCYCQEGLHRDYLASVVWIT